MASIRARLLVGEREGRFPFSNSLVIETGRGLVVVDAGAGAGLVELVSSGRVRAVIVSHYHPDHIRFLGLASRAGVQVYAPLFDAAYRSLVELGKRFAPPVWREWVGSARDMGVPMELPEPNVYENWGEIVEGVVPIWLPGHLYTHHGFIVGSCVYGSDVDLTGFGPWYGNPEASLEQFLRDIVFIASLQPREYCSSHSSRVYRGVEVYRELAWYASIPYRKSAKLLQVLSSLGHSRPRDLAGRGVMYPRIPERRKRLYLFFDEMLVAKTLSFLEGLGLVYRDRNGYYRVARQDYSEVLRGEEEGIRETIESYA